MILSCTDCDTGVKYVVMSGSNTVSWGVWWLTHCSCSLICLRFDVGSSSLILYVVSVHIIMDLIDSVYWILFTLSASRNSWRYFVYIIRYVHYSTHFGSWGVTGVLFLRVFSHLGGDRGGLKFIHQIYRPSVKWYPQVRTILGVSRGCIW